MLKQLTIEELLQLDVTLPLRHEERVMDAPAAVVVLTNEDLRRQGAVSLPEALRHVPGLFVGRFSGSSWIVASRGFASTTSNKILAMIDGRTVYSPLFSGIFWEQQDALLFDIERVEVIRGPGASLWGSNAVNGVINVVSKRAADTQGLLFSIGGGSEERLFSGVRYGGRAGVGHYRVYGKFFDRDAAALPGGGDAQDGQRMGQGGFRLDAGGSESFFTLQGDLYRTEPEVGAGDITSGGANVLARWTRRPSPRSELQVQAYYDRTHRAVPSQFEEDRDTIDLDVQQRVTLNGRHALSGGASYRYSADDTVRSERLVFEPADRATQLVTAFVQDEFAMTSTVTLMPGLKIERNDYTGVEWQPSARVRWAPDRSNTVWGAVSRAVRLPTRFDTDVRLFAGPVLVATGNPDFRSESVVAFELGYRTRPHRYVAFDFTGFVNRYDNLRSQEFAAGRVLIDNKLNNRSVGGSMTFTAQPRSWARLTASYSRLSHHLSLDAGSADVYGGRFETIDPEHMGRLHVRLDLPRDVEFDLMSTFMGELPQIVPQVPGTPSYAEAGFRLGWRVNPRLELSLIGRDILNADHVEFVSPTSSRITRLQRAVFTRCTVAF